MQIDSEQEIQEIGEFYSTIDTFLGMDAEALSHVKPEVSSWSLGQQIVHISMAHSAMWHAIQNILEKKSPASPEGAVSLGAIRVLESGSFPRNRFSAPEQVTPPAVPSITEIQKWGRLSKLSYTRISARAITLPEHSWFIPHPLMGPLDARAWIRTINIHGKHHLSIMHEIESASI